MENCITQDTLGASVTRGAGSNENLEARGVYYTECFDSDGNLKWADHAYNLVVNQGKGGMLDTYFAGSAYTGAWWMSLITAGTATSASTYASPTVTETTSSIIAARIAMGWVATLNGTKSATATTFAMIGSAIITGNMVVTGGTGVTTVGNTAATGGILFSAANFAAGPKTVSNGDTLNVTYSIGV
jgi:hypothetical protein